MELFKNHWVKRFKDDSGKWQTELPKWNWPFAFYLYGHPKYNIAPVYPEGDPERKYFEDKIIAYNKAMTDIMTGRRNADGTPKK